MWTWERMKEWIKSRERKENRHCVHCTLFHEPLDRRKNFLFLLLSLLSISSSTFTTHWTFLDSLLLFLPRHSSYPNFIFLSSFHSISSFASLSSIASKKRRKPNDRIWAGKEGSSEGCRRFRLVLRSASTGLVRSWNRKERKCRSHETLRGWK